jgi:hypothetical protein
MRFPPNWSMESILVVALAAAVIVVVLAQGQASERTRFTVESTKQSDVIRHLRPSFTGDDTGLGR